MNIKTSIGNVVFNSPIFNASGPRCTSKEELFDILFSNSAAIVTKSCTLEKRYGNEKPRYWDNDKLSINSMGLPNNGYEYYIDVMKHLKYFTDKKPFIISVAGLSCEDNITIINSIISTILEKKINLDIGIEINLSCPNIIGHGQLAYDFAKMDTYLNQLFTSIDTGFIKLQFIGVKLPPYFELYQFKVVADILKKYPINFITTINSIGNGLVIDVENECSVILPKEGIGGLGGSIVKQTALSNVFNFHKELIGSHIRVIGCGGVESGTDVFEYLLAGACAVQVGTQFYREGRDCFKRIEDELIELMKRKKYKQLDDIYGKLNLSDVFINE
jgi:dihydroorotate dehydrogenase (fumarate)